MKIVLDSQKIMNGNPWTSVGSLLASLMFVLTIVHRHSPNFRRLFKSVVFAATMLQQWSPYLRQLLMRYIQKLESTCDPYIHITFYEHASRQVSERNEAYVAIQNYLEASSSCMAKRLNADSIIDRETLVLSMTDNEEIADEYRGVKVWWTFNTSVVTKSRSKQEKQGCYTLIFHNRNRDLITKSYMKHLLARGKEISLKNRQRKLYTNKSSYWIEADFEHPATFETLALKPETKKDIVDDLITFSEAKDYYTRVGKAWKRGYLLYGPPGTGKSTLIAAMANLLHYDVYDLELTSVKDNTDLKKLLTEIRGKSIIVIEDIDCSLNLTGKREMVNNGEKKEDKQKTSQVTLSGLLNAIDGLWSSCAGEKIIVFTTNYVENLDPALIRRGRMDKHIELSYCSFEAFKVLAKNYLDIESHELFGKIEELLAEINISPADVAESLMVKSVVGDGENCLKCLISVLKDAKDVSKANKEEKAEVVQVHKKEKTEELLADVAANR
ncbi:AAA-ATPase At3g28580-like [Apium graveolens]|uniref:AAA-ATPase At3g28580-like n=1 Tax=Apium graveolens TaxID=4045 RepID=UPI003D7B809B